MGFDDLIKSIGAHKRSISTEPKSVEIPKERILVITDMTFLVERTEEGELPPVEEMTIAPGYRDYLLEKYDEIVIAWEPENESFLKSGGMSKEDQCPQVTHIDVSPSSYVETTERLISLLCSKNIRMLLPRNRRSVSWINLGRFTDDKRVDFVKSNDHSAFDLKLPKKKSFNDSAKERSRSSNW